MARNLNHFECTQCGFQTPKWLGRCPECQAWSTLEERSPARTAHAEVVTGGTARPAEPVPFPDIRGSGLVRLSTAIPELDRVLGGGLVPGAGILIGGEPGIGKSTLLLQAASMLAQSGSRVLYVSGEESASQLRIRGQRLGVNDSRLLVLEETDVNRIIATVLDQCKDQLACVIIDSIQAVACPEIASVPGSVSQVRESATRLMRLAKANALPLCLVGHVTKEGGLAGPRTLEHLVDTVIQFEGDRHHAHRVLRTLKNRFGPSDEIGVFRMTGTGLDQVPNPSEVFLAERPTGVPGSTVHAAIEGSRTLLLEIQALVGEPFQGTPRRTSLGIDSQRLALILAVLQRRAGMELSNRDIFVNVAGGLNLTEPASDLALASAVASSYLRKPVSEDWVLIGELGLAGELRSVSRLDARLKEAQRLGFTRMMVPGNSFDRNRPTRPETCPARHLTDALDLLFK